MLVGLDGPDDAAVWKISEDQAIVITTDFFTPVVDTPYEYGAIAAANSLSDVYAMGAKPFLALNISAFPPQVSNDVLSAILLGGAEKCKEAGVVVAGGHTIQDNEPKFGLVVIGFVDPKRLITKRGAKVGDALYLTKPLGVGTTTTALKREILSDDLLNEAVGWMSKLNDKAANLAVECGVVSGTDITGFGFIGHAMEVADASEVKFVFDFDQIPFLSNAKKFAEDYVFPGGSYDNRLYFIGQTTFAQIITEPEQLLLFDAQTSGGLLLCVPPKEIAKFETLAQQTDIPIWRVGFVDQGNGIEIR